MTIYYCIYALLGITALWCSNFAIKEKNGRKAVCFIAFLALFLMFALRHQSMGVDLAYWSNYGYLGRFDEIAEISWSKIFNVTVSHYERGYIIFNKLISFLNNNRQFFLGSCAFCTLLPIIYVIYKKSVSPFQSIVIYMGLPVFLLSYSGLRQALAIGLCTLSLIFIQNKKPLKFVLLVLLAATFHKTSMIFLIAYPIYHLKLTQRLRWISVAIIPVVYILRYQLFAIFSKLFKENAVADDTGAVTLFMVFTLVYIFCIIYSDNSDEQNGLMNLFFMACVCQAFGDVYNTAMRVGYYFMVFLMLLLPLVIKGLDVKVDKPVFSAIITVCFVAFGLYSIYSSTWARVYPYYFFWQSL